ncbi:DUF3908 family protein [Peribacillus frigoritolerans]|uniref:DUF3908 family protein n=1 Tax=Peribacillus frigoritolerans TaxID=450367 RepID=UPI003627B4D0
MGLTFEEFKEDIVKRRFDEKSRFYNRLLDIIEPYVEESKIKCFYPKNLFNGNAEKEFIFFLEKYIVTVTFQKEERYFLKSIPIPKGEISLEIPEYAYQGVQLTLENKGEEVISLNSSEDSNSNWNDEYIENIKKVYKFLIER